MVRPLLYAAGTADLLHWLALSLSLTLELKVVSVYACSQQEGAQENNIRRIKIRGVRRAGRIQHVSGADISKSRGSKGEGREELLCQPKLTVDLGP